MHVPVWITSDFICPWCYIGEKRLFDAAALLEPGVTVDARWVPFELDPTIPAGGVSRRDYRTAKFGSWERARALDAEVVAAGAAEGIPFAYDRLEHVPNTFAAHCLVVWAQRQGGQRRLVEALFRAYFAEARDIGSIPVLAAVAAETGLDAAAATAALESGEAAEEVRALQVEMLQRGIHGVPFFNIWGVGASGAAPAEQLKEVFDLAIRRRKETPTSSSSRPTHDAP